MLSHADHRVIALLGGLELDLTLLVSMACKLAYHLSTSLMVLFDHVVFLGHELDVTKVMVMPKLLATYKQGCTMLESMPNMFGHW